MNNPVDTFIEKTPLKKHIKGYSEFRYYRDNHLWYETDTRLMFPVPIEDIGNATFCSVEKSMLMMRYIRKYLDSL